ncbi:MAG: conjugal transfer protein TraF [Myxococcota bacterium]
MTTRALSPRPQSTRPTAPPKHGLLSRVFPLAMATVFLGHAVPERVHAEEWSFIGARYQGMGGAGVALVDDEHASYWNPGALAFGKTYGGSLTTGAQVAAEGTILQDIDRVANFLDDLGDGEFDQLVDDLEAGNPIDPDQLATAINLATVELPALAGKGEGVIGSVNAALLLRKDRIAISGIGNGFFAADPVFDSENLSVSSLTGDAAVDQLIAPGSAMDRYAPGEAPDVVAEIEALFVSVGSTAPNLQAEELVFQAEQAGVNVRSGAVASGLIDLINATVTTATGNFADNGSGAFVRGLAVEEVGFAYAHPFLKDRIGIGGNLKYMVGTTFNKFVRYDDVESGSDLLDEIGSSRRRETTHTASLDLGLLAKPFEWLRFGLTARNITSPEFDLARDPTRPGGRSTLTLDPQVRAGAALWVLPNWTIAFDADLTKNESALLDGFESRIISLGTEYKIPLWKVALALRGGAYLNTESESKDAIALTGGLGLNVFGFNLDLAVGASPKTQQVEAAGDEEIPSRANVSAMISYRKVF